MISRKKRLLPFLRPFIVFLPVVLFSAIALILRNSNIPDLSFRPTDTIYLVSNSASQVELSHEINFSPKQDRNTEKLALDATLKITVRGPFRDTLKVLIPFEAEVLAKSVRREETLYDMHAFVTELDLKRNESKTLQFRYRLTHPLLPYLLRISPGPFQVKYAIKAELPDYLEAQFTNFSGTLTMPRFFRIRFGKATSPLRFVKGGITNLSEIRLEFNRSLNRQEAQDILNFSLEDTNETYQEVRDRLLVISSTVQDNALLLRIRGMTKQAAEVYKLTITNLRDRGGNSLQPLPFSQTLVQPMLY